MGRLLELIFFAFLLWLAWEGVKARVRAFFSADGPRPQSPARRPTPAGRSEETLVRCAACGTHVLQSRALPGRAGSSDLYCSERCRTAGGG
jgi:hypothetical protein